MNKLSSKEETGSTSPRESLVKSLFFYDFWSFIQQAYQLDDHSDLIDIADGEGTLRNSLPCCMEQANYLLLIQEASRLAGFISENRQFSNFSVADYKDFLAFLKLYRDFFDGLLNKIIMFAITNDQQGGAVATPNQILDLYMQLKTTSAMIRDQEIEFEKQKDLLQMGLLITQAKDPEFNRISLLSGSHIQYVLKKLTVALGTPLFMGSDSAPIQNLWGRDYDLFPYVHACRLVHCFEMTKLSEFLSNESRDHIEGCNHKRFCLFSKETEIFQCKEPMEHPNPQHFIILVMYMNTDKERFFLSKEKAKRFMVAVAREHVQNIFEASEVFIEGCTRVSSKQWVLMGRA